MVLQSQKENLLWRKHFSDTMHNNLGGKGYLNSAYSSCLSCASTCKYMIQQMRFTCSRGNINICDCSEAILWNMLTNGMTDDIFITVITCNKSHHLVVVLLHRNSVMSMLLKSRDKFVHAPSHWEVKHHLSLAGRIHKTIPDKVMMYTTNWIL